MSFRGQVKAGKIRSRVLTKHTQSAQLKSIKWFDTFCQDAVKRVQEQADRDRRELSRKISIAEGRNVDGKRGGKGLASASFEIGNERRSE